MDSFVQALETGIKQNIEYYNNQIFPSLLDSYKLLHNCAKSLFDILEQRSLIVPDPYKGKDEIKEIKLPSTDSFAANDRAQVMGYRLSEYESLLSHICNFVSFKVDLLDMKKVKELLALNSYFLWNNMSSSSKDVNTASLSELILDARKNSPALTLSMLSDLVNKAAHSTSDIAKILKNYASFYREFYKFRVRIEVYSHPEYKDNVDSPSKALQEMRRVFPKVMSGVSFYPELIKEIANEDFAGNREELRSATLKKLEISPSKTKEANEEDQDFVELLLSGVRSLASLGAVYGEVVQKLFNNVSVVEASNSGFFSKLKKAFRKAFNMKEPPLIYDFIIIDEKRGRKIHKNIDINQFIIKLSRKASLYVLLSNPVSAQFQKLRRATHNSLGAFLSKQISENNELAIFLNAADDFFKSNVSSRNRSEIKGLKMDLLAIKNAILKANEKRAEYFTKADGEGKISRKK